MSEPVEPRRPTPAEMAMANSINTVVQAMLRGELGGVAVCAVTHDGDPACFYLNAGEEDVLRPVMERLRVMYETNRNFNRESTAPKHNRSLRSH